MTDLYTIKNNRALQFISLKLAEPTLTVRDIALLMGASVSTIQKHDNALKRIGGYLGESLQELAFASLDQYDKGKSQVESVSFLTDHKMVSDLVSMRWALTEWARMEEERVDAMKAEDELKLSPQDDLQIRELRIINKFRGPIETVTDTLNEFLSITSVDESPEYETLLSELTEAIIELEETLMS